MGFNGNLEDYYDHDNSYVNKVLERRTGIPISMALVYMEVAARVGLPMVAVNLPAHLMVRPAAKDLQVGGASWQADASRGLGWPRAAKDLLMCSKHRQAQANRLRGTDG
eukprot:363353-Chlamydomonas_euryale.AAC.8